MSDIFISYKSEDRGVAAQVASGLEQLGLSVWWDRKIPVGGTYDDVIEEALRAARCVVVLWSEASTGSDWVKTEAAEGSARDILVPALIANVDPPLEFRRIQAADLSSWDGSVSDPAFQKLSTAVKGKLATIPRQVPAPVAASPVESNPSPVEPSKRSWLIAGGISGALLLLALGYFILAGGGSDDSSPLPPEEAAARLEVLVAEVDAQEAYVTGGDPVSPEPPEVRLPPIDGFPLVVTSSASNAVVAEIFVSSEKSGSGDEGWMVEVAEAFNGADVRLSDGRLAQVEIRKIASGIGYEFLAAGRSVPDAYSPSNHLWIEMARARGAVLEPIRESMVANVAGLVMKADTANELRDSYTSLDSAALIDAVVQDRIVMGYTDPFVSSTGLNFLVSVLRDLGGGTEAGMLSDEAEATFREFQENVPIVALTTLQLRDSVVRDDGQLDAFVMEHQTYVNTDILSDGFEFVPFGIRHDNPLYAVGNLPAAVSQVLESFAEFADSPEYTNLAQQYGFDPEPYDPPFDVPSGQTLIEAQNVWKENKDAGEPVTAVFVADVSGSMQGSRIAAVQDALMSGMKFIDSDSFVGMVVFSDTVTHVLPIRQFDLDQQSKFAKATRVMRVGGGTAMYDGIAVGLQLLQDELRENPDGKVILIVLTDGETMDGMQFEELDDVIAGLRIPIYTMGFEADIDELARLSKLVEAASINASEDDVEYLIGRLFNAQL